MSFYDLDLVTIDGTPQKMDVYRGKTLLIVNVASQCGFTPRTHKGVRSCNTTLDHHASVTD